MANEANGGNGWKERMDRFERGLEHLLQTQAQQQTTIDQILESQRKNEILMGQAPLSEEKLRAAAAFLGARRSLTAGKAGRPSKPTACAKCGEVCPSARAAVAHCLRKRV